MPPALAFVGPSASSRRILSGAGGRQEFAPESATRGRVGLDSTRVGAVLKARAIWVGSLPGRLLFGCDQQRAPLLARLTRLDCRLRSYALLRGQV